MNAFALFLALTPFAAVLGLGLIAFAVTRKRKP